MLGTLNNPPSLIIYMPKTEIVDLESRRYVSVVMIFSVQKLSLCVVHNCEYIFMLQVRSATYNKRYFIYISVWLAICQLL